MERPRQCSAASGEALAAVLVAVVGADLPLLSWPVPNLDELRAGPPSVEAFHAILAELDRLDGPELEAQIAAAEASLASWPDETRRAGEQVLLEELAPDALFKPTAVLVRMLAFEPSHGGCEPWFIMQLARSSELSRLTILDLFAEDVDCDGAAAIATSPVLQNLRDLRLGQALADDGFLAIARSPQLARLAAWGEPRHRATSRYQRPFTVALLYAGTSFRFVERTGELHEIAV